MDDDVISESRPSKKQKGVKRYNLVSDESTDANDAKDIAIEDGVTDRKCGALQLMKRVDFASYRILRWFTSVFHVTPSWYIRSFYDILKLECCDKTRLYDAIVTLYTKYVTFNREILNMPQIVNIDADSRPYSTDNADDNPSTSHPKVKSSLSSVDLKNLCQNHRSMFDVVSNKSRILSKTIKNRNAFWIGCEKYDIQSAKNGEILIGYHSVPNECEAIENDTNVVRESIKYLNFDNYDPNKNTHIKRENIRNRASGVLNKDDSEYLNFSNGDYFGVISSLLFKTNVSVRKTLFDNNKMTNDVVVFLEWVDKTIEMMLYYYVMLKCGCAVAYIVNDPSISITDVPLMLYDLFGSTPEEQVFLFLSWWKQYCTHLKKKYGVESKKTKPDANDFMREESVVFDDDEEKISPEIQINIPGFNDVAIPPSFDVMYDKIVTDLLLSDVENIKSRFLILSVSSFLNDVSKKNIRCANYYIYRQEQENTYTCADFEHEKTSTKSSDFLNGEKTGDRSFVVKDSTNGRIDFTNNDRSAFDVSRHEFRTNYTNHEYTSDYDSFLDSNLTSSYSSCSDESYFYKDNDGDGVVGIPKTDRATMKDREDCDARTRARDDDERSKTDSQNRTQREPKVGDTFLCYNYCVKYSELCEVLKSANDIFDYDDVKTSKTISKKIRRTLSKLDFDKVRETDAESRYIEKTKAAVSNKTPTECDKFNADNNKIMDDLKRYTPKIIREQLNHEDLVNILKFKDISYDQINELRGPASATCRDSGRFGQTKNDRAKSKKNSKLNIILKSISTKLELVEIISLTISRFIVLAMAHVTVTNASKERQKSGDDIDDEDKKTSTTRKYNNDDRSQVVYYLKEYIDTLVVNHLKGYLNSNGVNCDAKNDNFSILFNKMERIVKFLRHNKPIFSQNAINVEVKTIEDVNKNASTSSDIDRVETCATLRFTVSFNKEEPWIYSNINAILNVFFSLNKN